LSGVVATSFSRTFYRMAIDLGLPIITCPDAVRVAKQGAQGRVDTSTGDITFDGKKFHTTPLPKFVQDIVDEGGLTNWVKREVQRRRANPGS